MSKLDDILNECKDYMIALVAGGNPPVGKTTKQQIKELIKELWDEADKESQGKEVYVGIKLFQKKVDEL